MTLSERIRAVALKYHVDQDSPDGARYYRRTIGVAAHGRCAPAPEDVVDFLYNWGIRKPRTLDRHYAALLEDWGERNESELNRLRGKTLGTLRGKDYASIQHLAAELVYPLRYKKVGTRTYQLISGTIFGKAMHCYLPDAVLLWDEARVRENYGLLDDPFSFVCYQAFGRLVFELLGGGRDPRIWTRVVSDHLKDALLLEMKGGLADPQELEAKPEPPTKIIDELAYSPRMVRLLMHKVGSNPAEWYSRVVSHA